MRKKIIVVVALLSMMALLVPMAFAPTPIVQQVTGGGWILGACGGEFKKTFGFNAEELEGGALRGNVEFDEHGPFGGYEKGYPHVHGYEITSLYVNAAPGAGINPYANIEGICRLNGDNTPRAFRVHVEDADEPGKYDWFEIEIPSIGYHVWAKLGFPGDAGGGGNIQIHRP